MVKYNARPKHCCQPDLYPPKLPKSLRIGMETTVSRALSLPNQRKKWQLERQFWQLTKDPLMREEEKAPAHG